MALTNREIIYLNRDNSIDLQVYSDSSAADLASVTEIRLALGSVTISSTDSVNGLIRWNKAGYETGEIRILAGLSTALSTGRYNAALVVFDAGSTNGIVWDDNVPIHIKSDPLTT